MPFTSSMKTLKTIKLLCPFFNVFLPAWRANIRVHHSYHRSWMLCFAASACSRLLAPCSATATSEPHLDPQPMMKIIRLLAREMTESSPALFSWIQLHYCARPPPAQTKTISCFLTHFLSPSISSQSTSPASIPSKIRFNPMTGKTPLVQLSHIRPFIAGATVI